VLNGGSFQLKTIIRREYCVQVYHPHFCISTRPLVNEDYQSYPDAWTDSSRSSVVIHHYVTKSLHEWQAKYDAWRYKYGLRTMNDLADIERNCIVFDDSLKTNKNMEIGKTWQWASHQPLIKGVLDLYKPQFVLELGVGENSTPLFKGYAYHGIENNPDWIDLIRQKYDIAITFHDLDKQTTPLAEYYGSIALPMLFPRLLFVDNYESCRMIAINTLRDRFDLIIFHDCEPEPGARINHYEMINSEGFMVYFLKTPANWTALMVRDDFGFAELLQAVNPHIANFKKLHPEMQWMRMSNRYEE
jgi:hypothetical protein